LLQSTSRRIYGLDILRAFAILFVIIEHGRFLLPAKEFPTRYFFWLKIFVDGVSLFFVLSGYLIGGILIKTIEIKKINAIALFDFWIKRWLKTLPSYFLILIVLILLSLMSGKLPDGIFRYFCFSQNFASSHPDFFNEAWSLCVEEWFYILVPIFIFLLNGLLKIKTKISILLTSIFFLVLPIVFRYFRFSELDLKHVHSWDLLFRKQVVTRLDSIMYGVVGAYLSYFYPRIWKMKKEFLFITGIAILLAGRIFELLNTSNLDLYSCVFSFSINAVGALFLLPYLSNIKTGHGILFKIITFLSLISYSMYLLNLSVIQASIINKIQMPLLTDTSQQSVKYLIYWVLTLFFSFLLYRYFEKPIMNLRYKIRLNVEDKQLSLDALEKKVLIGDLK
jgi:peptidoglycan/LPS O-acetylase OafA/YrhL